MFNIFIGSCYVLSVFAFATHHYEGYGMRARLLATGMRRGDWIGLAVVAVAAVSAMSFRITTVDPREFVGLCASRNAPSICAVRHAVLWLQYEHCFGLTSLLLGLLAFVFAYRPLGVVALALGAVAIVNYNGTEGVVGAALGLWGWLEASAPTSSETP